MQGMQVTGALVSFKRCVMLQWNASTTYFLQIRAGKLDLNCIKLLANSRDRE